MSIEDLIPEDWSAEKAEIIADAFYEIGDAIFSKYYSAIHQLEQEQDRQRKTDFGFDF